MTAGRLVRETGIIDVGLGEAGWKRTGPPEEIRRTSMSTVLRVPTDRGPVWFKQTPPLFHLEARVIEWVSSVVPGAAPHVITRGDGWHITRGAVRSEGPPAGSALETLAEIQIRSIGRAGELAAIGCPERGPASTLAAATALVERMDLLGAAKAAALRKQLPAFARLSAQLTELALPCTLVHGDLHSDNACWTERGWVLLDWTDAALAHPFVDLTMFLRDLDPARRARATEAFARRWRCHAPARDVERALQLYPALGALHQAETHRRLADAVDPENRKGVEGWVGLAIEVAI